MVSLQSLLILVIFSLSIQRLSACFSRKDPNSGMMNVVVEGKSVCNGSLHLISTDRNVTLKTTDYAIGTYKFLDEPIQISSAETHGCGCFIIYTEKGDAKDIYEDQRFDSNDRDFFKKKTVKSFNLHPGITY